MTKTSLYKVRIFAAVAAALFIVQAAPIASASTMYSQSSSNITTYPTYTFANIYNNYFTFDVPGSLLSNIGTKYINYASLQVAGSLASSDVYTLTGTCYYSSSYTGSTCGSYTATTSTPNTSSTGYVINFTDNSSTIIASSTTYVRYTLTSSNNGGHTVTLSYNNSLSSIARVHKAGPTTLTSLGTPYLVLASNDIGGNTSFLQDISLPQNDSVVPTSARFYFTWWHGVDGYTEAGVKISDVTTPQSIYTVNTPAYSTGQNIFDQYINLTNNHLYAWKPYLYNPTTQSYIYGTSYRFSVGTQQSPFVNYDSSDLSGLGVTTTSLLLQYSRDFNIGTTTDPSQIGFQAIANGADDIRLKVPFDYIADMFVLLQDFYDGYNAANTSDLTWSYSNGSASTTLTIMSPSVVEAYPLITLLRNTIAMFIYVVWALAIPKFALKLL